MYHKKNQAKLEKLNIIKEEVIEIEKRRKYLFRVFFKNIELVEGSFINTLVRCGRSGCHCAKKPIHPVTRLSRWENKKMKNKIIRVSDREWVKKLTNNYKEYKKALGEYEKMNKKEKEILKKLLKMKTIEYE